MARIMANPLYPLLHDFLTDYLPQKRNCSTYTIKAYRTALEQLLDFAKERKNIRLVEVTFDVLDKDMVTAYLDDLEKSKKCSTRTRNYKLNCLRAFYNYAAMRNTIYVVYQAGILEIPFKKTEKAETIEYLSEKAVTALLAQPDVRSKKGIRNLFLMVLMYDTAARVQEIIDLKICDFRLGDTPQVKLHGKGNKYRTVPLMAETVSHYQRYRKLFHDGEPDHSQKPLFYTVRKNICSPLSDDIIRVFMNQYAKTAHLQCPEVPERIYPHIFRHSRAMHLYQHGMDLTLVSQWLGHANLSTTLIYAHADTEMKRAAIEKATGNYFPEVSGENTPYDVNDDSILKRLYGLKQ